MRISPRQTVLFALLSLVVALGALYGYTRDHWQAGADQATTPIIAPNVNASAPEQSWGSVSAVTLRAVQDDSLAQTRHYQVVLTLTNKLQSTLEFSPGLQVFVVDAQGGRYAATARYTRQDQILGGPIAGSGSWQGRLDFDVPAAVQPVQLRIEKDAGSQPLTEKL